MPFLIIIAALTPFYFIQGAHDRHKFNAYVEQHDCRVVAQPVDQAMFEHDVYQCKD